MDDAVTTSKDPTRRGGPFSRFVFGVLSSGGVFYAGWVAGRALRTAYRLVTSDDPATASRQAFWFRNTADGPIHDGFGLTYVGYAGIAWAVAQAALIVLGVAMCFAGSRNTRRAGAALTLASCSLWFGNMVYFAIISDPLLYLGLVPVHASGFALVSLFALRRFLAR